MKVKHKEYIALFVLAVFLSQQFLSLGFANNIVLSFNESPDNNSVYSSGIISDEAQIISDEIKIQRTSIPGIEKTRANFEEGENPDSQSVYEKKKLSSHERNSNEYQEPIHSIIVKYKENKSEIAGSIAKNSLKSEHPSIEVDTMDTVDIGVLSFETALDDVEAAIEEIRKLPYVEYAEPNYQRSINSLVGVTTNDTGSSELWHLKSIGAEKAWELYNDTEHSTRVSLSDSGIDYTHLDLVDQLGDLSSECKSSSGVTITGGCPHHGLNFEESTFPVFTENDIFDIDGHGTAVAGILGSTINNEEGGAGVTNNVDIISGRVQSYDFVFEALYISNTIEAIDFAIENNAKVINLSYGGADYSQLEYDALERARDAGILIIAAAGNEATDNDTTPHYPSSYDLDNIISVAAITHDDSLASYSNYGENDVDVAAPGGEILDASGLGGILTTFPGQEVVFEERFSTGGSFTSNGTNNDWYEYDFGFGIHTQTPLFYTGSTNSTLTFNESFSLEGATAGVIGGYMSCDFGNDGIYDADFGDTLSLYIHDQDSNTDTLISYNSSFFVGGSDGAIQIPISDPSLMKDNLQLKLNFITDSDDDVGLGCLIDDLIVVAHSKNTSSYVFGQGTSFSTPNVSGLASMLWSYDPNLSYNEIKDIILSSVDDLGLSSSLVAGGKINAESALKELFKRHGISKSGYIGDTLVYTENISLDQGKEIVLESFTYTPVTGTGSAVSLNNDSLISGSGSLSIKPGSYVEVDGTPVIEYPEIPFIDLKDSMGKSLRATPVGEELYGEGVYISYSGSLSAPNLSMRIRDIADEKMLLYNGPLQDNSFIPLDDDFSGSLLYEVYTTGEGIPEISDDIEIALYSDFTTLNFIASDRSFNVNTIGPDKEAGQDVPFSVEAIDYDGSVYNNYSGTLLISSDLSTQTLFRNELDTGTFDIDGSDNGVKTLSGSLSFSQNGNYEIYVQEVGNTSFSGSMNVQVGERTIPLGNIELPDGNISSTNSVTIDISSSEYPVIYTIDGDSSQTYSGSLNASGSFNIELSSADGAKELSLTLEDSDGNSSTSLFTVDLDTTAPEIEILSHQDSEKIQGMSMTLTGSINDFSNIESFTIGDNSPTIVGNTWSVLINLVGGVNTIPYTATDEVGNNINGGINIVRTPKVESITFVSNNTLGGNIIFDTDILATGKVLYGTNPNLLDNELPFTSGTSHSVLFESLAANTLYYYSIQASVGDYDAPLSSIDSFRIIGPTTSSRGGGYSKREGATRSGPLREFDKHENNGTTTESDQEAEITTPTIDSQKLMQIFIDYKEVFKFFTPKNNNLYRTNGTTYTDFIDTWKDISQHNKSPEAFLSTYNMLLKAYEEAIEQGEIMIGKVQGEDFYYIAYHDTRLTELQTLLFSYINKKDGTIDDYHRASQIVYLIYNYIYNTPDLSQKALLKQEILGLYEKIKNM